MNLDPVHRLLKLARGNSGQAALVADFLLAWWDAGSLGGFDPTILWALDDEICADIIRCLHIIAETRQYPDSLGLEAAFEELVRHWRPVDQ